jgi:hypothetical protein
LKQLHIFLKNTFGNMKSREIVYFKYQRLFFLVLPYLQYCFWENPFGRLQWILFLYFIDHFLPPFRILVIILFKEKLIIWMFWVNKNIYLFQKYFRNYYFSTLLFPRSINNHFYNFQNLFSLFSTSRENNNNNISKK